MKRAILAVALLLLSTGVLAAPNGTFSATAPTQYEDGNSIPVTDTLTYRVYCGNATGFYPYVFDAPSLDVGTTIDISACVQGTPGTYYFVATATSTVWASESADSNEITRSYTAVDLGKTPMAPTLFTIQ